MHLVLAAVQAADHCARFGSIAWFAERLAVEIDDRVGGDDQGAPLGARRFAAGMRGGEFARREMSNRSLIIRTGDDVDD